MEQYFSAIFTSNQLELESKTSRHNTLVDHVANNHRHGAAGAISTAICVDEEGLIDRACRGIGGGSQPNSQTAPNGIKTVRLERWIKLK